MSRRPLGAIVSQMIVAGSSLLLAIVVLRELGTSGLGTFSLLFGILVTVNSVQTGWIGDSLTVLDRFDPGIRRALFQSQAASILIIGMVTTAFASIVDGVDTTTAMVFGLASVAWAVEETFRRVLIARREFWSLVANDGAFAVGAFGLLALVIGSGAEVTMLTMMAALLAGAVVAIGVAVMQLPRIELVRGPRAPSRMRELASFAGWRAVQVGLRPGSLAAVRAIVAATATIEAVGELEAARLLIAPALTLVNGAGLYLLPTYADQVKRRVSFRPSVPRAMVAIGTIAAAYGVVALLLRSVLVETLTDGNTLVSTAAIASWVLFSIGFGVGLPAGSATVASGQSRRTFGVRMIDAIIGVALGSIFALVGWIDAVPAALACGAFVGAWLLLRSLRRDAEAEPRPLPVTADPAGVTDGEIEPPPLAPAHWRWAPMPAATVPPTPPVRQLPVPRPGDRQPTPRRTPPRRRAVRRIGIDWHRELLWVVPLVLIVATEYKFRRRSIDEALAGSIDVMIAVELLVCGVVGVWSLMRLVPLRPRIEPLMMIMWGYVLTTAVSALYSSFPGLALARAVELVIIATVVQLVSTEGQWSTISRLLHGWIVLISCSIVVGIAYVAPTTGPQEGRFTWLSVHSVSAGSMLAVSTPVLFGLVLASGRRRLPWPRWVYGALFLVHLVFLLLTRTRGSIGGALVAIAVMAWLSSGKRMKPELVLGSLVAGGALALAFGRPVLEFLTRGETVDQIGTFNRRTEIWSLAWESFLERPFFGLGFNSAKGVFFDETGLGGAHNSVINVMIDVGLVGLLWWFALVIGALVLLGRLRHRERRSPVLLRGATGTARSDELILIGIFVALLINSITTEGLGAGVNVMAIWMFIAVAWLTILDREERASRSVRRGESPGEVRNRQLEPVA